jgi:FkbM family methyltransferase
VTTQSAAKTDWVLVGSILVELLAEGDAIVRMMRNNKRWEPETRAIWKTLVRPGDVVVDVGAYTGLYSIASAAMGAKALAIEPHPANFRRIKANAAINSIKVDALWMAASDGDELCMLGMNKPVDQINDTAWLGEGSVKIPVVTKRLDDLVFRARICLIKIDVEHHEVPVLTGALQTICKHRPTIIVETLSPEETQAVRDTLGVLGYTERGTLDGRNRLFCAGDGTAMA